MRLPRIDTDGFRRIAQAALAAEPAAPAQPQVNLEQMRRDIETLHQWIDYFNETNTATQQEIEALRSQVEFLEEYVYSTTGQPETPSAPTPSGTGYATDYNPEEYMSYLQTLPYPPTLY